jgi:hypothetical protein
VFNLLNNSSKNMNDFLEKILEVVKSFKSPAAVIYLLSAIYLSIVNIQSNKYSKEVRLI